MNPVPLTDPQGVVRMWCCGACFNLVGPNPGNPPAADLLEHCRGIAERCCRCSKCGVPRTESFGLVCRACAEAERVEAQRERDRVVGGPSVTCPLCRGFPDHCGDVGDLDGDKSCTRCDSRGYVLAEEVPRD